MTSPELPADGSRIVGDAGFIYTHPKGTLRRPTTAFGVYCPASFRVDGLPYDVEFTVGPVGAARRATSGRGVRTSQLGIVSMRIGGESAGGVTREALGGVPVARMLAAAIHAAGIVVMCYPAGYRGPRMLARRDGTIVEHAGVEMRFDKNEPSVDVVNVRGLPPDADFHKAVAGISDGSEIDLVRVAALVRAAEADGRPFSRDVADSFAVTDRTARRYVQAARDADLLPPIPKTDNRRRKDKR